MVRKGDGVCTSIRFNFCAQNRVEIRFSDNPRQNQTINDIIRLSEKKCIICRLDIIFSITHVSKINLFCQRDIRRYRWRDTGRKIPNLYQVRNLQNGNGCLFLYDTWLTYLNKSQFMLTETHQISNLRSQDVPKEILSDSVRKNVAEFKVFHFQYAAREMCKGALNNYSMLK